MKRKILIIMTSLLVTLSALTCVKAASGSASVSVSNSSPVVGNKITLTIKLSCNDGVGAAMVYIDYNSSYLSNLSVKNSSSVYANGNKIIVDGADSKSVTITATLTTKKIGNTSIQVTVDDWCSFASEEYISDKSITKKISIVAKSGNNPSPTDLSKDASLASLEIEGLVLETEFESDVFEYTVYAPANTAVVKVNAKASSAKARIEKTEFPVQEGWNRLDVICTAENGDKKTYTLNVYVEEKPTVYFNENTLGVVKNLERLTVPEGFEERKLTVQDEEISVFTREKLNLIYLVDEAGQADFYVYDEERETVIRRYDPVEIDGHSYLLVNSDYQQHQEMEEDFVHYKVYIGETGIDGWKYRNQSLYEYAVIELMDENGNSRLYSYDLIERTVQRFTLRQPEKKESPLGSYLSYSAAVAGFAAFIAALVLATRKKTSA
ncbi:MAG: cadherin-like beta sandwich domain-containing protein [Erysipelotrichaceae bacterium]|nr:cadherin-like beta sandwich domain-containing protein [Erysipelotrichaceae bacterium]